MTCSDPEVDFEQEQTEKTEILFPLLFLRSLRLLLLYSFSITAKPLYFSVFGRAELRDALRFLSHEERKYWGVVAIRPPEEVCGFFMSLSQSLS